MSRSGDALFSIAVICTTEGGFRLINGMGFIPSMKLRQHDRVPAEVLTPHWNFVDWLTGLSAGLQFLLALLAKARETALSECTKRPVALRAALREASISGLGCGSGSVGRGRAWSVLLVPLQSRENHTVDFIKEKLHSPEQLLPLFQVRGLIQTFHDRVELLCQPMEPL